MTPTQWKIRFVISFVVNWFILGLLLTKLRDWWLHRRFLRYMAASDQTARTIVMVLLSEVEIEVATRIVNKLRTHSKGSKSHTQMILRRVYEILLERQQ